MISIPPDVKSLSFRYPSATPFPHLILDNLFSEDLLERVIRELPPLGDAHWVRHDDDHLPKLHARSDSECALRSSAASFSFSTTFPPPAILAWRVHPFELVPKSRASAFDSPPSIFLSLFYSELEWDEPQSRRISADVRDITTQPLVWRTDFSDESFLRAMISLFPVRRGDLG